MQLLAEIFLEAVGAIKEEAAEISSGFFFLLSITLYHDLANAR
jgi:hypothetical protein